MLKPFKHAAKLSPLLRSKVPASRIAANAVSSSTASICVNMSLSGSDTYGLPCGSRPILPGGGNCLKTSPAAVPGNCASASVPPVA